MARIQPIDPQTAPEAAKPYLDGLNKKLGRVPNIFKTMSIAPSILESYMAFSGAMAKSSLSPNLREQVALATAGTNACDYCASAHTAIGKSIGLTDAQTSAALNGTSDDAKTQAAMTFVKSLMANPRGFTDAQFNALKTAGFNDQEILELVGLLSLNIFTNFFNHVADTDVDFPAVSTQKAA